LAPLGVLCLLAETACRPSGPPLPEVRVYATVSKLASDAVLDNAARRRIAAPRKVATLAEADLAWFGDPGEALEAAAARLVPGSAAVPDGVDPRFTDPQGRFAPLAGRTMALVMGASRPPVHPTRLRDLLDRRLAGRQAVPKLGEGIGPGMVAGLATLFGEPAALGFLKNLAGAKPQVVATGKEARALVSGGEAVVAWIDSEEAAAGAASAAALEVIYPDQSGSGVMVLPTAVVLLQPIGGAPEGDGGMVPPAARNLAVWMISRDAEALLAARAPGHLPLRAETPVPVGVQPASNLRSPQLNWDRFAELRRRLLPAARAWPGS
jgi:iron(III) transport system substrate-binding protein